MTFDCFDLVALSMSHSTKPRGEKPASALPFPAGAPDSHITELLLGTAITHVVPGPSAKHQLTAAEAQLSMRTADKAYYRKAAKCDSVCEQSGLKLLPITT